MTHLSIGFKRFRCEANRKKSFFHELSVAAIKSIVVNILRQPCRSMPLNHFCDSLEGPVELLTTDDERRRHADYPVKPLVPAH